VYCTKTRDAACFDKSDRRAGIRGEAWKEALDLRVPESNGKKNIRRRSFVLCRKPVGLGIGSVRERGQFYSNERNAWQRP
jgi:hypothetical protein